MTKYCEAGSRTVLFWHTSITFHYIGCNTDSGQWNRPGSVWSWHSASERRHFLPFYLKWTCLLELWVEGAVASSVCGFFCCQAESYWLCGDLWLSVYKHSAKWEIKTPDAYWFCGAHSISGWTLGLNLLSSFSFFQKESHLLCSCSYILPFPPRKHLANHKLIICVWKTSWAMIRQEQPMVSERNILNT